MKSDRLNKQDDIWGSVRGWIVVNLIISFIITFLSCPSCFFSWKNFVEIIDRWILCYFISFALSYGSFWFEDYFDKRMPWIRYPLKRLMLQASLYLFYSFCVVNFIIAFYLVAIIQVYTIENLPWHKLLADSRQSMVFALIISAIFISRSFLLEWRNSAIEAEQLKSEKITQQYQSLKDQLNPHFLFNSLNVLSSLVHDQPDVASKMIRQLSKIYRYVLEVQHEDLVQLDQELDFAKNYLSLQKIRFEDGLQFDIEEPKTIHACIPPLSLQLLLENAVKHNIASKENPLQIVIRVEGDYLIVKNNVQSKRLMLDESAGVGLSNIQKRYELMGCNRMVVDNNQREFIVSLPLIRL